MSGRPVPAPSGPEATTEVHPFGVGKSTVRAQHLHHLYAIGRCSDCKRLQSHGRFSNIPTGMCVAQLLQGWDSLWTLKTGSDHADL
jgi:hypothetical protein